MTEIYTTIGRPTCYRTRHFFNNFTTNEDIATKFEAEYRHTLQTHSFSFLTQRTYSCNIFIGVRIIKEMPRSVASGTHCIILLVALHGCENWSLTCREAHRL